MKTPTLADMLQILVDTVEMCGTCSGAESAQVEAIAQSILDEHCAIPYCDSLTSMDPFGVRAGSASTSPGWIAADAWIVAWHVGDTDTRRIIADIDAALYRLANSGYGHKI